jgi:alkylation response protein AidB-like acyl-CoA dehydrogenase
MTYSDNLGNSPSLDILSQVQEFVRVEVEDYLSTHDEVDYPQELVIRLCDLGVFGANVPRRYGGLGLEPADVAGVIYELSRGWQSLASLVGTHLKLSQNVLRDGTERQKDTLLPTMVTGDQIYARAYHEQGRNGPEYLRTSVKYLGAVGVLNGHKNWVTNARNADKIIAIARGQNAVHAVVVDPHRPGVLIGKELKRPGMWGVSLAEVTFSDYEFDPDRDVLGGRDYDITESILGHDMTGYVTRALGSADAVYTWALRFVRQFIGQRPSETQGAINLRVGELSTYVSAIRAVWRDVTSLSPRISSDEAKVFCSTTLHEIIRIAAMLGGGAGYAGHDSTLTRHYRDTLALQIVGAPNDVLLSRIGIRELTRQAAGNTES